MPPMKVAKRKAKTESTGDGEESWKSSIQTGLPASLDTRMNMRGGEVRRRR